MDVKTKCLGMLFLGDATGYEIKKNFEEGAFSHFLQGSFGSIYPALAGLSAEGLITVLDHDTHGSPEGRRDKKTYRITEAGRAALLKRITGQPAEDKYNSEFLFQLIFAPYVSSDLVRMMLDQRQRMEQEMSEELAQPDPEDIRTETRAERFIRLFGAHIHKASADFIADNRHMLENEEKETVSAG